MTVARQDSCKQRACFLLLDDMDFICQYKLGLSGGFFKVREKKYVGAVVYVFVSYQYLSLPLQVRLSGCSFMR